MCKSSGVAEKSFEVVGSCQKKSGSCQKKSTIAMCDSNSTIKLSKNCVMHGRGKHIVVNFHFFREFANNGIIELLYCGSKE